MIRICFPSPFQPALYFLLSASRRESLGFAAAAMALYLYRFFYASGQAITGSLVIAFIAF